MRRARGHECRLGRGSGALAPRSNLAHGEAAWDVPISHTRRRWPRRRHFPAGLKPSDVDVWEINEAFSSVPIISSKRLELTPVASM